MINTELNITNFSWDLFALLCQGSVAGLIVLLVSNKLQAGKDKDLCQKHTLLMSLEVKGHIAMIDDIFLHQQLPECTNPVCLESYTWDESKQFLTMLPIKDLEKIGAYYQSFPAINHLLNTYQGCELSGVIKVSFLQTSLMAKMTYQLLSTHWDLENAEMHNSLYAKLQQQSADLFSKNSKE